MLEPIKVGESFYDYELKKKVTISKPLEANNYRPVVIKISKVGRYFFGWASKNYCKNIVFIPHEGKYSGSTLMAISKDIFPPNTLVWDNTSGTYVFTTHDEIYDLIKSKSMYLRQKGLFPYNIAREYNAYTYNKLFSENTISFDKVYNRKLTKLVPFTFGIEYETSCGAIPEEECFTAGLIPLRDGSIHGNEYASIVMNSENNDFERIKYQTEVLSEYTRFDKECSLHIHFGGFPLSANYLFVVYTLCGLLQDELGNYLPKYSYRSALYKPNGKDYCKYLKVGFKDFNMLYKYLSEGFGYMGSLTQSHPADIEGRAKWNIATRYHWVNFINACFYRKNKTIEFRILRPTVNYNKIINWIYVFSAILSYAKILCEQLTNNVDTQITLNMLPKTVMFQDIFNVYPDDISEKLLKFLDDCKKICNSQESCGDPIGEQVEFENSVLITNVLE